MRHSRFKTAAGMGLLTLLTACSSQPETPAKEPAAAPKPIGSDERISWYRACWNEFNDAKWDEFKKCYADNATSQQLGYGKPAASGPDAIVAGSQDFKKIAPDGRGEPQIILVNGNHLASAFLLGGTNSGPLGPGPDGKEMKATGKKFGLMFGHALELDPSANKVTKELGVMDGGSFANQIGLSKNPGRPVMTKGADMPTIVAAKNDDIEKKNLEVDKAGFAAWNMHDTAATDAVETPDMVLHDFTQAKDLNKTQNSEMNSAFWKSFPDSRLNTELWAAGDYVVVTGTFEGTNDADFPMMKLKKTGRKVTLPFLEIDRFENGKVREAWFFIDSASLAGQLGVGPAK